MTDKEHFQRIFDKLHASPDVLTEVLNMATKGKIEPMKKKRFIPKVAVAVVALVIAIGSGSVAYATDLGGIQRIVQVWIHGDQTDATFTVENGSYTLDYKDADGNVLAEGTPIPFSGSWTEDTEASHNSSYGNAIAKNITNFVNNSNSNHGYYIGRYEAGVTNYDTANIVTSNSESNPKWTGYNKVSGGED